MSTVKSKRSASTLRGNRTDAILKRMDILEKQIERQMAELDASMKEYEPIFRKMKAALPQRSADQRMDSVKRHRLWQSKLDKDNFFDDVFGRQ